MCLSFLSTSSKYVFFFDAAKYFLASSSLNIKTRMIFRIIIVYLNGAHNDYWHIIFLKGLLTKFSPKFTVTFFSISKIIGDIRLFIKGVILTLFSMKKKCFKIFWDTVYLEVKINYFFILFVCFSTILIGFPISKFLKFDNLFICFFCLVSFNEDLNSDATIYDISESPTHQKLNSRHCSLLRDCWV